MARILIVEDDPISMVKGIDIMKQLGHETFAAKNGAEAAEAIRQLLPDAILLDVELPDTNGFDFGQKLKAHPRTKQIPIAYVSGRDKPADYKRGFASGGRVYLAKPYTSRALNTALTSLLTS